MIYQVTASLLFFEHDEAADFYHDCQLALAKASLINLGSENQEASVIRFIENHHDDDPNQPCAIIFEEDDEPS